MDGSAGADHNSGANDHPTDRNQSDWFDDPAVLLKELKKTTEHWAEHPRIAGYDEMVEISRGGQGVIYRARQLSTNRTVAIKVLLDGIFASMESRSRFQREIELVSRLRHPHLVQIHDSGLTNDNCLYYVMEYVDGVPLGHGSRTEKTEIEEILRLFVKICKAVNHAHQHAIIHRDLKPNNILIDREGEPRILDFGLAKIVDDPGGDPSVRYALVSRTGQFFGSLAWAAPEQIERSSDRMDTRTDIYSLGVILYQLLTDRLPHEPTQDLHGTIRAIVSETPERPRALNPDLPADVETILMRCLAKEPERRYQSAGDLQQDIERYLNDEPIEARRDHTWYVLGKTMRRHKAVSALIVLVLLLVVGFSAVMAMLYPRAVRAEQEARENLDQVRVEMEKNKAVRGFLTDMLSQSDPFVAKGREVTVREVLDVAARRIERSLNHHPDEEAEIRSVLGSAYYHMGHLEEAEKHDRIALDILHGQPGADPVKVANVKLNLVLVDLDRRRFDEAEKGLEELRRVYEEQVGKDHPYYANCLHHLGSLRQAQFRWDEARAFYEEAHEIFSRSLDSGHDRYIINIIQWAGLLISIRDLDAAIIVLNKAVKIIDKDPAAYLAHRGAVLFYLGLAHFNGNQLDEAEKAAWEALESQRKVFGEVHLQTADIYTLLGNIRRFRKKYDEAESFYRKTYAIYEELAGQESAECASSLWTLADTLWRRGDRAEAEAKFVEALRIRKEVYGADHHLIPASVSRIAMLFGEAGLWEKAKPYFEEALALQKAALGEDHPRFARAQAQLGECLFRAGDPERGEELLLEALAKVNQSPEPNTAYLKHIYESLIDLCHGQGRVDQATEYESLLHNIDAKPSGMLID